MVGYFVVRWVEVYFVLSCKVDVKVFVFLLVEFFGFFEDVGFVIVVEYCDVVGGVGLGEKEFFSLDDEIIVVVGMRVYLMINWGCSVVEFYDFEFFVC